VAGCFDQSAFENQSAGWEMVLCRSNNAEAAGSWAVPFQTNGRLDLLDDNVVLGLFNYPTEDVGPDGTHELDIELHGGEMQRIRWATILYGLS
jgi:hypothetical protein